jgi:hypothetical protein
MAAYALAHNDFFMPLAEVAADWRAVHTELQALGRGRGRWDARVAQRLRDAERLRIWREVGEPSMLAYIERVLGYGPRSAYDRMRVARELGGLPMVEAALERGAIFYSLARELTRVATWETERVWLDAVQGKSLREVESMTSGRAKGDLPDAPSRPENVRHVLSFDVSAETYALFRQAKHALKEETGEALDDDRFLALLARRALQPASADGPRDQIATMKCVDCGRAFQDGGGAVVEIAKEALETAECTGDRIDAEGRVTRHIPEATRRAVRRRDHARCRVPWCRSTGDLHDHHIQHFAKGGGNGKDNLITLCWSHHRDLHDGKLRLDVDNGHAKFTRVEVAPANDTRSQCAELSIVPQAIAALVGMGFRKPEASSFVEAAIAPRSKELTLKELLREALRRAPTPS